MLKDEKNVREIWCKGLSEPMPASERMIRHRIRRKAIQMAIDLCLIWHAGVAPGGRDRGEESSQLHREDRDIPINTTYKLAEMGAAIPSWVESILRRDFKGLK